MIRFTRRKLAVGSPICALGIEVDCEGKIKRLLEIEVFVLELDTDRIFELISRSDSRKSKLVGGKLDLLLARVHENFERILFIEYFDSGYRSTGVHADDWGRIYGDQVSINYGWFAGEVPEIFTRSVVLNFLPESYRSGEWTFEI